MRPAQAVPVGGIFNKLADFFDRVAYDCGVHVMPGGDHFLVVLGRHGAELAARRHHFVCRDYRASGEHRSGVFTVVIAPDDGANIEGLRGAVSVCEAVPVGGISLTG